MIQFYLENPNRSFKRATDGSAGFDVEADLSCDRVIEPGNRHKVWTGLYLQFPDAFEAQVRSRSGLSLHHGIVVANGVGTIDSDYRGECCVTLINHGKQPYTVHPGDRIAQIVFAPVIPNFIDWMQGPYARMSVEVRQTYDRSSFTITDRGSGGMGSTGR